jgi:hypothetical protein
MEGMHRTSKFLKAQQLSNSSRPLSNKRTGATIMDSKGYNYWYDLNRTISLALNELLSTGKSRCMHLSTAVSTESWSHLNVQPLPGSATLTEIGNKSIVICPGSTSGIPEQSHGCKKCREDIISRAHSGKAHRYIETSNAAYQNWLLNDRSKLDVYADTPHPSGFEQNINGLGDEHLQRVEQYWINHQLRSPLVMPGNKLHCCPGPTIRELN